MRYDEKDFFRFSAMLRMASVYMYMLLVQMKEKETRSTNHIHKTAILCLNDTYQIVVGVLIFMR